MLSKSVTIPSPAFLSWPAATSQAFSSHPALSTRERMFTAAGALMEPRELSTQAHRKARDYIIDG